MRKAGVVAVVVAAAVVLSPAVAVAGVHVTHPRDEAAFLDYFDGHLSGEDTPPTPMPSTDALLEQGDRACAWLATQPWAMLRTDEKFRFAAMADQYLDQMSPHSDRVGPFPTQYDVAGAAWTYLCPATRYLQKPHYVFNQPGD